MYRGIVELHVIYSRSCGFVTLFTLDIKILSANSNSQAAPYFLLDLAYFRTLVRIHVQIPFPTNLHIKFQQSGS